MMLNALLMRQMQTKRLPVQKWTSNQEINWNAFELIMKNLIKILSAKMLYAIFITAVEIYKWHKPDFLEVQFPETELQYL